MENRNASSSMSSVVGRNVYLLWKVIQRRIYSLLNTNIGLAFSTVIFLCICYYVSLLGGSGQEDVVCNSSNNNCVDYTNNIGNVDSKLWFVHEPIDVVYTWVNGSDPVWLEKKNHWTNIFLGIQNNNNSDTTDHHSLLFPISHEQILNSSIINGSNFIDYSNLNSSIPNTTTSSESPDDTMSQNRYRDSEELRYSLRSLLKNAPWIRRIYLVTDNQLPYWINLENDGKLIALSHSELFENKSVLPVFSSPAIETQLHKIPGLSQKFIYFNDDVFLGSPVYPDDFVSLQGAQKFYMAWEVPKCAPGCSDNWIGDGVCDKVCNVSACNFDYPDCINASSNGGSHISTGNAANAAMCIKQCPDSWLADKVCDQRCRVPECAYDIGDCGLDLVKNSLRSVFLSDLNSVVNDGTEDLNQDNQSQTVTSASPGDPVDILSNNSFINHSFVDSSESNEHNSSLSEGILPPLSVPLALRLKIGTKAAYFNTSFLPCKTTSDPEICNSTEKAGFVYTIAEHFDDKAVVHHAVLLSKHHALVFLLYYGQEDAPPSPPLPHIVKFIVGGYNSITNKTITSEFFMQVDPAKPKTAVLPVIPSNMGAISGYIAPCSQGLEDSSTSSSSSAAAAAAALRLAPQSFQVLPEPFRNSDAETVFVEGVSITLLLNFTVDFMDKVISDYSTFVISTEVSGRTSVSEWRLFDTLGALSNQTGLMEPMLSAHLGGVSTFGDLFEILKGTVFREDDLDEEPGMERYVPLTLLLPSRRKWAEVDGNDDANHTWVHSKVIVALKSPTAGIMTSRFGANGSNWLEVHCAETSNRPLVDGQESGSSSTSTTTTSTTTTGSDGASGVSGSADGDKDNLAAANNSSITNSAVHCDIDSAIKDKISTYIMADSSIVCVLVSYRWGIKSTSAPDAQIANRKLMLVSSQQQQQQSDLTASTIFDRKQDSVMLHGLEQGDRIVSRNVALSSVTADVILKKKQLEIESDFDYEKNWRRWQRRLKIATSHKYNYYGSGGHSASSLHDEFVVTTAATTSSSNSNVHRSWITNMFYRLHNVLYGKPSLLDNSESLHGAGRRLTDTYAASLVHVNRLYSKDFGFESRKVPAHMPHMIDKTLMTELQERYPKQFKDTAANRFRSPTDMQYSFSYYYYAMNRNKASPPDIGKYISDEVDSNKDGLIDDNEFRTLASIVYAKSPSALDIELLHNCSNTSSVSHVDYQESILHSTDFGNLRKSFSLRVFPKISELVNCSIITTGMRSNVDWSRYRPTHTLGMESQIAFEMVGDNYTETIKQLDSVRQRQSKFVCINDNMKEPVPEVVNALKDFYESFFPYPSKFELPPGTRNPTLYLDEYKVIQSSNSIASWASRWASLRRTMDGLGYSARDYGTYIIKRVIQLLQYFISDENDSDNIEVVISRTRQDLLSSSVQSSSRKNANERTYFGAFTVLFSFIGLIFIYCLSCTSRKGGRTMASSSSSSSTSLTSRGGGGGGSSAARFKSLTTEKMKYHSSKSSDSDNDDDGSSSGSDRGGENFGESLDSLDKGLANIAAADLDTGTFSINTGNNNSSRGGGGGGGGEKETTPQSLPPAALKSALKKVSFGPNSYVPHHSRQDSSDSGDFPSSDGDSDGSLSSANANRKKRWYPGKYWDKFTNKK